MGKLKIITKTKTIEAHYWECPKCAKEIVGSTPQQVAFNAGLHLESHKREEERSK